MKKPVNVYGLTEYWENGLLECVYDGFGYRDSNGNITWYDGYNPPKDITTIVPYGNGCDLSELLKGQFYEVIVWKHIFMIATMKTLSL